MTSPDEAWGGVGSSVSGFRVQLPSSNAAPNRMIYVFFIFSAKLFFVLVLLEFRVLDAVIGSFLPDVGHVGDGVGRSQGIARCLQGDRGIRLGNRGRIAAVGGIRCRIAERISVERHTSEGRRDQFFEYGARCGITRNAVVHVVPVAGHVHRVLEFRRAEILQDGARGDHIVERDFAHYFLALCDDGGVHVRLRRGEVVDDHRLLRIADECGIGIGLRQNIVKLGHGAGLR